MHLRRAAQAIFGVCPGKRMMDVDSCARRSAFRIRVYRRDNARAIHARRIRQGGAISLRARAQVGVHGIHARRMEADYDFARARGKFGHILEHHDLGCACFMYANRFHRTFLSPAVMPLAVTYAKKYTL